MTDYPALENEIRKHAREWLESGAVKYVVGYERGAYSTIARPGIFYKPEDVERLIWDPTCVNNLTKILVEEIQYKPKRGEEPDLRPVGIVVKPCDSKTIIELIKENIVPRERVKIIGAISLGSINPDKLEKAVQSIPAGKLKNLKIVQEGEDFVVKYDGGELKVPRDGVLNDKCKVCKNHNPVIHDVFIGTKVEHHEQDDYDDLKEIEAMSEDERYQYWKEQLSRCVRCYACRDTCPLCYCVECVFDKTKPFNWNEKTVDLPENFFYHMVRAMHLAGRCIDCGECERACPMDIPIRKLNRILLKQAKERFKIYPGMNIEDDVMFGSYDTDDPGEGIW